MKKNVRIKLFKDNGRYNAPVFVGLNEYTALIPRGVEDGFHWNWRQLRYEDGRAADCAEKIAKRLAAAAKQA